MAVEMNCAVPVCLFDLVLGGGLWHTQGLIQVDRVAIHLVGMWLDVGD